jgi:hypothetical protein
MSYPRIVLQSYALTGLAGWFRLARNVMRYALAYAVPSRGRNQHQPDPPAPLPAATLYTLDISEARMRS